MLAMPADQLIEDETAIAAVRHAARSAKDGRLVTFAPAGDGNTLAPGLQAFKAGCADGYICSSIRALLVYPSLYKGRGLPLAEKPRIRQVLPVLECFFAARDCGRSGRISRSMGHARMDRAFTLVHRASRGGQGTRSRDSRSISGGDVGRDRERSTRTCVRAARSFRADIATRGARTCPVRHRNRVEATYDRTIQPIVSPNSISCTSGTSRRSFSAEPTSTFTSLARTNAGLTRMSRS
jgi:hypothetical protein